MGQTEKGLDLEDNFLQGKSPPQEKIQSGRVKELQMHVAQIREADRVWQIFEQLGKLTPDKLDPFEGGKDEEKVGEKAPHVGPSFKRGHWKAETYPRHGWEDGLGENGAAEAVEIKPV